jgi:hypothetical protein
MPKNFKITESDEATKPMQVRLGYVGLSEVRLDLVMPKNFKITESDEATKPM